MDASWIPHADAFLDELLINNWKTILVVGVILRGLASAFKWNWAIAILDSFRAGIGAARGESAKPIKFPKLKSTKKVNKKAVTPRASPKKKTAKK